MRPAARTLTTRSPSPVTTLPAMPIRSSFATAALSVLLLGACGGGDTPVEPLPETVSRVVVSAPATTLAPAQSVQFTATPRNAAGGAMAASVEWRSSANAIATVNAAGIVTGVAPGTATITATAGGVAGTVDVTVTTGAGVLATLALAIDERTIQLGQTTQARVSGIDGQGMPVALGNRTATWSSSLPTVAVVSSAGVVTGVGVGIADIQVSVTDGATPKTGTVRVIVESIPGAPLTIDVFMPGERFSPFQAIVKQGGTVRFLFPSLEHNVIWERRFSGAPADIPVTANTTVTRVFPTVGVFDYKCTLHPGMDGQIVVSP